MQVNATLIAAQQAAREAQVRFQAAHTPSPGFAAALEKAAQPDGFAPLPLKQVAGSASPAPQAAAGTQAGARMGTLLDITV